MNPTEPSGNAMDMTLDPPGTIAVVGAGPLGVEAALYGRYLGYDVTLIEADTVGSSLRRRGEEPLPILPTRCLSSLALAALEAQKEPATATSQDKGEVSAPLSCLHWAESLLVPVTETDLLRGRLRAPIRVTTIEAIPAQLDADDLDGVEDTSSIPPDFRLRFAPNELGLEFLDVEAVILAVGTNSEISFSFPTPAPYFFQIGSSALCVAEQGAVDHSAGAKQNAAEQRHRNGLKEIVAIYAGLVGREDLDLYRPRRL